MDTRPRQGNSEPPHLREGRELVAGLVSLEDGCINAFVQRGTRTSPDHTAFLEMGGRQTESSESSRATESAVRGFWYGYRRIMGFANEGES